MYIIYYIFFAFIFWHTYSRGKMRRKYMRACFDVRFLSDKMKKIKEEEKRKCSELFAFRKWIVEFSLCHYDVWLCVLATFHRFCSFFYFNAQCYFWLQQLFSHLRFAGVKFHGQHEKTLFSRNSERFQCAWRGGKEPKFFLPFTIFTFHDERVVYPFFFSPFLEHFQQRPNDQKKNHRILAKSKEMDVVEFEYVKRMITQPTRITWERQRVICVSVYAEKC